MFGALSVRFARNGGHGSIEEREILNLSWGAEGFGVISGCAFFTQNERKRENSKPAPTVTKKVKTSREGAHIFSSQSCITIPNCTRNWIPVQKTEGHFAPNHENQGLKARTRRSGGTGQEHDTDGSSSPKAQPIHTLVGRFPPSNCGNSRVTAPRPPLCYCRNG